MQDKNASDPILFGMYACFKVLGLWGGLNIGPWVAKIERLTHVFDRLVCRDIDMLRVFENERASFSTSCSLGKFQKSSKVGLGYRYSTQQSEICLLCQKIITKTDLPEPIRLPSVCLVIINSSCSECIWWNWKFECAY